MASDRRASNSVILGTARTRNDREAGAKTRAVGYTAGISSAAGPEPEPVKKVSLRYVHEYASAYDRE